MSTFRDEGPLALEPRILLDAAALTTIEVTADLPDPATQVEERQQDQAQVDELVAALSAGSSRTVIFIDARVPDAEALLGPEVLEASDVFVIEGDVDGVAFIEDTLARYAGTVQNVHIVSHGEAGELWLGSAEVNGATLSDHADSLAGWAAGLTSGADVLLYGCNVAEGDAGRDFVEQLAALTGADFAASTDLTGSLELGGDAELEFETGAVTAESALTPARLASYSHLLAPDPTVTINAPDVVGIGTNFTVSVTFDTDSTGFGPYVELYLPTSGVDGVFDDGTDSFTSPADGISFVSAALAGLGIPLADVQSHTITDSGVQHPYAVDAAGNPIVITAGSAPGGFQNGDTVVFVRLPFGSFTTDQPAVTVDFTVKMSNLADLSGGLAVAARGGFSLGQDALDNFTTDVPFSGNFAQSGAIDPNVVTVDTSFGGEENETATGPNYP